MGGSARACNVYWRTAQAATLTDSVFKGTVMTGTAFTMTRGSFDGRGLATTNATVTDAASMNFAGCAGPTQIVVNKDFSDGNTAAVPMNLSCTSGTVATTPLNASESTPAVFSVTGADLGATCTATEGVPTGYTPNETGCASKLLGSSCTIINSLALQPGDATITVNKDFSPNSNALVPVTLACTNNMVPVVATLNAAEGTPAIFVLRNPTQGTTCTATETVPLGYTANQTGCVGVALNGSCTMTNTLITAPSTIPTLSEWALIMISAMLGMAGFAASRKKA